MVTHYVLTSETQAHGSLYLFKLSTQRTELCSAGPLTVPRSNPTFRATASLHQTQHWLEVLSHGQHCLVTTITACALKLKFTKSLGIQRFRWLRGVLLWSQSNSCISCISLCLHNAHCSISCNYRHKFPFFSYYSDLQENSRIFFSLDLVGHIDQ